MEDQFHAVGAANADHLNDTAGGTNNITGLTGNITGGVTTLRFFYPLNSGEAHDVALVPGKPYNWLLANDGTAKDFTTRHDNRGVVANSPF